LRREIDWLGVTAAHLRATKWRDARWLDWRRPVAQVARPNCRLPVVAGNLVRVGHDGRECARDETERNGRFHRPPIKEVDMLTMLIAANGVWLWTTIAIFIWIMLAFWPARVAAHKGHSFFGYFLFSLVFFPAALIVAYLVSDRTHGVGGTAIA
jgi:hypothetical protein